MPTTINPKLISWASDIEPDTIRQAEKTARLPIVEGHVALMPDAHVGIGWAGATTSRATRPAGGCRTTARQRICPRPVGSRRGPAVCCSWVRLRRWLAPQEPIRGQLLRGEGLGRSAHIRGPRQCASPVWGFAKDHRAAPREGRAPRPRLLARRDLWVAGRVLCCRRRCREDRAAFAFLWLTREPGVRASRLPGGGHRDVRDPYPPQDGLWGPSRRLFMSSDSCVPTSTPSSSSSPPIGNGLRPGGRPPNVGVGTWSMFGTPVRPRRCTAP